jgi:hypothetical protein
LRRVEMSEFAGGMLVSLIFFSLLFAASARQQQNSSRQRAEWEERANRQADEYRAYWSESRGQQQRAETLLREEVELLREIRDQLRTLRSTDGET